MTDNKNPLVSVVMPTYNQDRYIGRAVKSVSDQTYTNWELIIIDNGSTDNTWSVLEEFSDQRIRILKIENNGIIAKSRNRGIKISRGQFIAFLDSDDWWHKDKIRLCIYRILKGHDLVYHRMQAVGYRKSMMFKKIGGRQLKPPVFTDLLIKGNPIVNSSVIVRKNFLSRVSGLDESPSMVGSEDYNLWLKVAKSTDKFIGLDSTLGYYRYHHQSVSNKGSLDSHKSAIVPFLKFLNNQQQEYLFSELRYSQIRRDYLAGRYREVKKSALVIANDGSAIRFFKCMFMYITSNLKIVHQLVLK